MRPPLNARPVAGADSQADSVSCRQGMAIRYVAADSSRTVRLPETDPEVAGVSMQSGDQPGRQVFEHDLLAAGCSVGRLDRPAAPPALAAELQHLVEWWQWLDQEIGDLGQGAEHHRSEGVLALPLTQSVVSSQVASQHHPEPLGRGTRQGRFVEDWLDRYPARPEAEGQERVGTHVRKPVGWTTPAAELTERQTDRPAGRQRQRPFVHEQLVQHRQLRPGEDDLPALGGVADPMSQGSTVQHPPRAVEPPVGQLHHHG